MSSLPLKGVRLPPNIPGRFDRIICKRVDEIFYTNGDIWATLTQTISDLFVRLEGKDLDNEEASQLHVAHRLVPCLN